MFGSSCSEYPWWAKGDVHDYLCHVLGETVEGKDSEGAPLNALVLIYVFIEIMYKISADKTFLQFKR